MSDYSGPAPKPFKDEHGTAWTLGIPKASLKAMADNGEVPFVMLGKRRFYNIDQITEALKTRAATQITPTVPKD